MVRLPLYARRMDVILAEVTFLGMLGELLQRMDDPYAEYGLALPYNRQYRGLVQRLPALARQRLGLVVFWVYRETDRFAVDVDVT